MNQDPPPDWEEQLRACIKRYQCAAEWTEEEGKEFNKWLLQPWVQQTLLPGGRFHARWEQLTKEIRDEREQSKAGSPDHG